MNPGQTGGVGLAGGLDAVGAVQAAAFPADTGDPTGAGNGGGPETGSPEGHSAAPEEEPGGAALEEAPGVRLGLRGRAAG